MGRPEEGRGPETDGRTLELGTRSQEGEFRSWERDAAFEEREHRGQGIEGLAAQALVRENNEIVRQIRQDGKCPACESRQANALFTSTDRLYQTTDREFRVVECAECRLIRLDPVPEPHELEKFYPKQYWFDGKGDSLAARLEEGYRRFVLADHVRFVARAIEECEEKGPVLDVGCGGGLFLRMMNERGYDVAGLDFSESAAAVAWKQNRVPVVCARLEKAPLPAGVFAAVTMFHVLEHLYDPVAYLNAAHQLLRPDGRLIVQVPNASCWQFLMFGKNWNGVDVPRHLLHFKKTDLDLLLNECGFDVLRHKDFSLRDNPAGLATSLATGLDPMARRVRGVEESQHMRLLKDACYFGLVMGAIPFTLIEAACGAGSTIMVEARKKK